MDIVFEDRLLAVFDKARQVVRRHLDLRPNPGSGLSRSECIKEQREIFCESVAF
jgi:hypothetical protein